MHLTTRVLALALAAFSLPAHAVNIATDPGAHGISGYNFFLDGSLGTPYVHAGTTLNLNDGNPTSRVDTFGGYAGSPSYAYFGILFDTPQRNVVVDSVTLTHALFFDGGWFGVNGTGPGGGGALVDPTHINASTVPRLEITTDGGTSWTEVSSSTNDYLAVLTGFTIGGGPNPNPRFVDVTFPLDTPVAGINGIRLIGSEGGNANAGFVGAGEIMVNAETDPNDADGDGLPTSWEDLFGLDDTLPDGASGSNGASGDPDGDGLSNADEFANNTDPTLADTDGDGVSDLDEVNFGSDPNDPTSLPGFVNVALEFEATPIFGVHNGIDLSAPGVQYEHAGSASSLKDDTNATSVDTWNGGTATASFSHSYAGILWDCPRVDLVTSVSIEMALFFDGGWWGVNGTGPGAGGALIDPVHVSAATVPTLQASFDGGLTWSDLPNTNDYLAVMTGTTVGAGGNPNPTIGPVVTFTLDDPQVAVSGIRVIGSDGGTASGGFLGVREFSVVAVTDTSDVDGDGLTTKWEEFHGLDDTLPDGASGDNGADGDPDGDGLSNLEEYNGGTDPRNPDTDGDGLLDGVETNTGFFVDANDTGTDPKNPDSDGDGLLDGVETNTGSFVDASDTGTDPHNSDSDGDFLFDGEEVANGLDPTVDDSLLDNDSDGLNNIDEIFSGTDPSNPDTDGDGLLDGEEFHEYSTDPLLPDTDGDGLSDGDEVNIYGTDPTFADSDFDGIDDGTEVAAGTDPNDANSFPLARSTILGMHDGFDLSFLGTPFIHAGQNIASITDGNLATYADTFGGAGSHSYVGFTWNMPFPETVTALTFRHRLFSDGGAFGPNNVDPSNPIQAGQLIEPELQISFDSGLNWTAAGNTNDYLALVPGTLDNTPSPLVTFTLDSPQVGISGIRLIGSHNGITAPGGGFLGVTEVDVLSEAGPAPLRLTGISRAGDLLTVSWESLDGETYTVRGGMDLQTFGTVFTTTAPGEADGESEFTIDLATFGLDTEPSLFVTVEQN